MHIPLYAHSHSCVTFTILNMFSNHKIGYELESQRIKQKEHHHIHRKTTTITAVSVKKNLNSSREAVTDVIRFSYTNMLRNLCWNTKTSERNMQKFSHSCSISLGRVGLPVIRIYLDIHFARRRIFSFTFIYQLKPNDCYWYCCWPFGRGFCCLLRLTYSFFSLLLHVWCIYASHMCVVVWMSSRRRER